MVTRRCPRASAHPPPNDQRDEGLDVLAAHQPSLSGALLAAKAAGYEHVILDGTLIYTDRIHTPGPTPGGFVVERQTPPPRREHPGHLRSRRVAAVDLERTTGREHDTTAARQDPDLLATIAQWVADGQLGLADLGYEGEADLRTSHCTTTR